MQFPLLYMASELRRRRGRALLTDLGLAAGVGLLIALIGVSQGLSRAQDRVLSPLSSVGADILVTRVAGAQPTTPGVSPSATPSPSPSPGQGRGLGGPPGGGFFGSGQQSLNAADLNALLAANQSVVTDLSKLGKAGTKFTHDFFLPATLLTFPQQAITDVSKIPGVASAVGGLSLLATHQTGTVPKIVATLKTGGQTLSQNVTPPSLTAAQRAKIAQCFANQGRQPGTGTRSGPGAGAACLPGSFGSFRARFQVPIENLRQVLDPPQTDITSTSYSAAGVDAAHPDQGAVTREQLVTGRFIAPNTTNEVLLNVAYANKNNLKTGSKIPVNGTNYTVVGTVNPTLTGNTADIYFSLPTMQKLASQSSRVNVVLVKANSAADVDRVVKAIQTQLPGAQVVTTKVLADQVTGSLSDAKKLADRFGGALAIIVLLAAFAIAVLLTLSAVAKRVREIGTLRAIGWPKAKVVRQLLLETTGIGVLGAALGIGIGVLTAVLVQQLSPTLTASKPTVPGQGSSSLSQLIPNLQQTAGGTEHVALTVPLHISTLLIGVAVALLGGLLAGAVGGWRAARLAPAVALRDLG
jgi:putative ABC transport system permease protein